MSNRWFGSPLAKSVDWLQNLSNYIMFPRVHVIIIYLIFKGVLIGDNLQIFLYRKIYKYLTSVLSEWQVYYIQCFIVQHKKISLFSFHVLKFAHKSMGVLLESGITSAEKKISRWSPIRVSQSDFTVFVLDPSAACNILYIKSFV